VSAGQHRRRPHRIAGRWTAASSVSGQATVELALMLPLIAALLLLILQVVVICQAQLALQNGVREAARSCAVELSCDATETVRAVVASPVAVTVQRSGSVQVDGTTRVAVFVPLLRQAVNEVELSARAVMREEHSTE
jgi:Flp pilus assembly protein TadG